MKMARVCLICGTQGPEANGNKGAYYYAPIPEGWQKVHEKSGAFVGVVCSRICLLEYFKAGENDNKNL